MGEKWYYIAFAAVLITFILSGTLAKKPPPPTDAQVQSVSQTCETAKKVAKLSVASDGSSVVECVKP